ncbi:undecaprenyl-phosphate glucose phosphotransferase [Roseospira marina]|nr:undecaprenyl-phosphate glucose phosphotransferase [Roseospira marina]MBB4312911.1 Undecaprenyl-phosphate glucose phosphotransferase [Roseospira marina]MBB5086316.1 Undecaprenyl-phosphate glucose phosphotransferase [Roseospira marina]
MRFVQLHNESLPHKSKSAASIRSGTRIYRSINFIVFYADVTVLVVFGVLSCWLYGLFDDFLERYLEAIFFVSVFFSTFSFSSKLYDWRFFRMNAAKMAPAFRAAVFAFGAALLVAFAFKTSADYSRIWGAAWFTSFLAYVLISRAFLMVFFAQAEKRGYALRRAVIVGAGENGLGVLEHLRSFGAQGVHIIGFLDDRADRIPAVVGGLPVLGGSAMAETLVRDQTIDLVILALPWSAYTRVSELVDKLAVWPTDIYMAPDMLGLRFSDRPLYRLGGMHVLSLKDRPISDWNAVVKRIEDLAIAIPSLIVLGPLLALIALAIKMESPGPALFVQNRYGFSGNLIRVYKFRSMRHDTADAAGEQLTERGDPRVTRVGAFIRRTSLDELPQLLNVLEGTMSVVGPRPHAVKAKAGGRLYEDVVAAYASRHRVRPGITGWAQCNGWRGSTDTEDQIVGRVEYDLYYVENWSLFLDLVIIIRTLVQVLRGDGNAY